MDLPPPDLDGFWHREDVVRALAEWVEAGLGEDCASEDITTRALLAGERRRVVGTITAEADGVFCGGPAACAVFRVLDPAAEVIRVVSEGSVVRPGLEVMVVRGDAAAILGGERTALNILCHLSGIATRARSWSRKALPAILLDTRKTLPGLRLFQRYAVRAGGGRNHRAHLADAFLVKENHRSLFRALLGAGAGVKEEILEIVARTRGAGGKSGRRPLIIEVEDEESFLACMEARVDVILLDNRSPAEIEAWIAAAVARGARGRTRSAEVALEASGGITADNLDAYARTGVDRISTGAITHSVVALDLSLHVAWED